MRITIAALSAALIIAGCSAPGDASDTSPGVLHGPYPVVRAVDGDTIRVNRAGEEIVVRLIGLDTPETVAPDRPVECFGPEASARTTDLVTGGEVWLEYDEASGLTDKYDRTLAFVWLDADTMLNEILIAEGFAEEVTYTDGYAHQRDFRQAESRARDARVGLWAAC